MAYAVFGDVESRAGRFAGLFSVAGKKPDQTQVEAMLDDIADELDAAIEARGFDPASMDARSQGALKDLNAYGALARALPAANPGAQADGLVAHAAKVWDSGVKAILDGKHAVIRNLESGKSGAGKGSGGGDFWSENPSYGSDAQIESDAEALTTSLAPAFERHQTL